MEAIGTAIGVVFLIVAIILIVKFVKMLFTSDIISRVLSMACTLICLIAGIVSCLSGDEPPAGALWTGMVTAVFGWLFFIGPVVFDIEWDGTYKIDWDRGEVRPGWRGGFIMNFIGAALVIFFLYGMLGQDFPSIYVIVPICIGLLNAWSVLKSRL